MAKRPASGDSSLPTGGAERRRAPRYVADPASPCQCKVSAPRAMRGNAVVRDLSIYGIGLTLTRSIMPGTVLSLQLSSNDNSCEQAIDACVIHSEAIPNGYYKVGCAFAGILAEDEVHSLLGTPVVAAAPAPRTRRRVRKENA